MESNNLINRANSETIHRGEYINLRTDELEKNGKIIAKRDVVEHVGSIVAVPYEINDQNIYFYLVRQWRNPLEDWVLEFPAGTLNSEENHEIAVVRELQEEIGMRPTIIDYWSYLYVAPGWCTEKIHCYMAGGLKKSKLISLDLETTSVNPIEADIVGFSFSINKNSGWYIPILFPNKKKNIFNGEDDLDVDLMNYSSQRKYDM